MLKYSFILLLFVQCFLSCKKKDKPADDVAIAKTTFNVSYASDARNKMDVYLPANRSEANTPVIVLIHGGGWADGDKADFTPFVDTLKRRLPQYAIFNITYRLVNNGQNLFPAQEQDVKKCIEYINTKRSEYKISATFILIGASAGGHLALLQSYKYTSPIKVKAVVSFFGPTELTQLYNNPPNPLLPLLLFNVTGANPTTNPAIYQQSSPATFAVAGSSPTLLLHGGLDPLIPASQSTLLRDKLNTLSVPNQYVFYPNGGHGDWDGPTYFDAFNKIDAFLKIYNP